MVAEALGKINSAHFVDLNKNEQAFDLPYQARIKLCEEAEKRVNYLLGKCAEYRIQIHKPASMEAFNRKLEAL
jgi:vacuolar-type H+-ATPase subunit I/STV1